MTQAKEIAVGELVAFSSGEYSDYSISAFSRVLKPLNAEVWDAMKKANTEVPAYDVGGPERFYDERCVPWLIANGYIEELPHTELHLGDYGRCPNWDNA